MVHTGTRRFIKDSLLRPNPKRLSNFKFTKSGLQNYNSSLLPLELHRFEAGYVSTITYQNINAFYFAALYVLHFFPHVVRNNLSLTLFD